MNIDDLTIGEVKQLTSLFQNSVTQKDECLWEIGKVYFIRTVTMHLIGKVEKVTDKEILISSASWIADSGRFHDAIKTGKLNEIEPFISPVIVGRGSLIDATEWEHNIPTEQK